MTQPRKNSLYPFLVLTTLLCLAWNVYAQGQDTNPEERGAGKAVLKTINSGEIAGNDAALANRNGAQYGISYHGGPLMLADTRVYYIWYGDWSRNTAPAILQNFAENIGN